MSDEVDVVKFEDLSSELKEKVVENFKNADYLVPDDWYEHTIDEFLSKYDELDIDKKSIQFDTYRNDYEWEGSISFKNEKVKKIVPEKFYFYFSEEWISNVSNEFKNGEFERDYSPEYNIIYDDLKRDIFPVELEVNKNDNYELSVDIYKPILEKNIQKYSESSEAVEIMKKWLKTIVANGYFFQDEIEIDDGDIDELLESLESTIHNEISHYMDDFYDALDAHISTIFDEFADALRNEYEYYESDDYANDSLSDKSFRVFINEDGEEEIEDLDGEW